MSQSARVTKAIIALACLLTCKLATQTHAEPVEQATIEAAMTLQLLSFTEWPAEQDQNVNHPRKIGIFQCEEHFDAFSQLTEDIRYKGKVTVALVHEELSATELAEFDALFFGEAEDTAIPRIIRKLEKQPIVLIGAFDGFLEQGGMVNLIKSQKKVRFEIHLSNSKRNGIEYRAKLLRLAAKVIRE